VKSQIAVVTIEDLSDSNWRLWFSFQEDERAKQLAWVAEGLAGLYAQYNRAYFADRLPTFRIVMAEATALTNGYCDEASSTIYLYLLGETIWIEQLRGTLLHEMVHAATSGDHDERFCSELHRIAAMGQEDAAFQFDEWSGKADDKTKARWKARRERANEWQNPDFYDGDDNFVVDEDDPYLRRVPEYVVAQPAGAVQRAAAAIR
jgi:hypothetical protein